MHISNLELHGFKSFGKKVNLKFGRGITAVVGPNGCGKTNIVDALRWVLGEQKQSVIRAGRMEEIIFNGSRQHKPSSLCEVSLTIHNDKSKLPSEYTDVEITRRIYRDGESEYLLNRQPCRLKDITDLFIDTGMGIDAYSVIELKMVEGILSDLGEDRRRMFEEAAGINKYKKQRASTYRKLEATRQDLERISDLTSEVDSKVRGLGLQLKRYERHRKLSAGLSEKELTLARLRVAAIQAERGPLENDLNAARASRDREAGDISTQENAITGQRAALEPLEGALDAAKAEQSGAAAALNEHRQQILVWREQKKAAEDSLRRLSADREREAKAQGEREGTLTTISAELEALVPDTESRRKELQSKQEEEAAILTAYREAEAKLEEEREKKFSHRQKIADATAKRERVAETNAAREKALDDLHTLLAEGEKQLDVWQQKRTSLLGQQQSLEAQQLALSAESESASSERDVLDNKLEAARERVHEALTQIQLYDTQLTMLERLTAGHEGYPAGTRAILEMGDSVPGVLGTVADLMEVEPVHALAVETALGAAATALVTETRAQAKALLALAKDKKLGRLSVIALDAIAKEKQPTKDYTQPGISPMLEVVNVPQNLNPLYAALLSGISLGPAVSAPGESVVPSPGVLVITPEGHRIGAVPIWVHADGQSEKLANQAAVVGRSSEIDRLRQALAPVRSEASSAEEELQQIRASLQKLDSSQKEREAQADQIRQQLLESQNELNQLGYEEERTAREQAEARKQLPLIKDEINQLKAAQAEHDKTLSIWSNAESRIESDIAAKQASHAAARETLESWRKEVQELRVGMINLENEREKLAERRLTLEDAGATFAERIEVIKAELKALEATSANLESRMKEADTAEPGLAGALKSAETHVDEQERAVREMRNTISGYEAALRSRQHERESALGQLQSVELRVEQLRQEEQQIRVRVSELYEQEVGESRPEDEELTAGALQEEVGSIRRSLERIGPVNMAVTEEHEQELERLTFITGQRDDLIEAEKDLLEAIEKVDRQAREQFQDTYDKIRYHFKQTFTMFFEGGEGDLRLVGNPDPLDSDIEIIAVPPGKKTRSLRSLSAGEKTLTAIALLFAIYMVKPSPYCILDEVDAPLDDVNIGKFLRVINKFADETQFIIVTHNKLSMEQADYLYGVTMQEEGLSTLVSVNMNDYAA